MNEIEQTKKRIIVKFIILFIILLSITGIALYFSFRYIDEETLKTIEELTSDNNMEEKKEEAKDKIYALSSYTETYDENSLKIKEIDDKDINYIQIDGLKDKGIQNEVNKKLKEEAYNLGVSDVYSYVSANFANILSVVINGSDSSSEKEEIKTFNIDLTTGEDIPLEKVFVSSAPINLYLANALYENLAWNFSYSSDDDYESNFDMDKRDTSAYEDEFLMLANKYQKEKGNIKYSISPRGISIYELTDDIIEIDFLDYIEEVAIYKRYLTKNSIFENDDIGKKGIIIFTNNFHNGYSEVRSLSYGKITDNIFLEEEIFNISDGYNEKAIKNYINTLSNENKEKIKSGIKENEGAIYQIQYYLHKKDENDPIEGEDYSVEVVTIKASCTKEYFEEKAFREYIKMKNDSEMMGENTFYEFRKYGDLKIKREDKTYYLDSNGKLLKVEKE